MTNPPDPPVSPNYNANTGARLTTDRFAFQQHVDGYTFRHVAGSIDLSPHITLGAATLTDVQTAIAALAGSTTVPVIPDATPSVKGLVKLAGDFGGLGTTASVPKVGGLQGFPVSSSTPTTNQVLTWNGTTWTPASIVPATSSVAGTVQLQGDLAGVGSSSTSPRVSGLQGFPILSTTPTTNQVLTWNGSAWTPAASGGTPQATASTQGTVQLSGDLGGTGSTATTPRVGGVNGATVPAAGALTTGHVLQVTGTSALTYGFVADANVSGSAAIAGSKISPNFGSQSLTAGTSSLGNTTITGSITASSTTGIHTLNGSVAFQTRTTAINLIVDTTLTDHIIFVNTNAAVQITLPTPTAGRELIIKDIIGLANTNNITLVPHGAEKIEGLAANKILASNWGSWTVVSNGTDWFLI